MCYPCTHCDRCRSHVKDGVCFNCTKPLPSESDACHHCGAALPPKPGMPAGMKPHRPKGGKSGPS